MTLQMVGLFAGIGGIECGFSRAGMETSMLVENDRVAAHVLRARFPDAKLLSDVRELEDIPGETDIITAGFPCQDLSSVGRKNGITGTRSSLVGEVFRLLQRRPVPWVVLENVPFLLHLGGGDALGRVTTQLQALGYRWAYRVVDAAAFGLPQRRRRWFLVASLNDDPRRALLTQDAGRPEIHGATAWGFYWTEGTRALGWAPNAIPPLKCGSTVGVPSPPAILLSTGEIVAPDIRDAERLQGFRADWTRPATEVDRPTFRWRLVGNAVSVRAAEWVARRMVEPSGYRNFHDDPTLQSGARWPAAAWFDGERVASCDVSDFPVRRRSLPIEQFLKYSPRPLSARAARGFLGRARMGSLRFAPGFLEAVEAHAVQMEMLA